MVNEITLNVSLLNALNVCLWLLLVIQDLQKGWLALNCKGDFANDRWVCVGNDRWVCSAPWCRFYYLVLLAFTRLQQLHLLGQGCGGS